MLILFIIIIVILVLKKENFSQNECIEYVEYNTTPKYPVKKSNIFVSIASYRDIECSDTLDTLFNNARYPNNIYVGICEQNKEFNENELCYDNKIENFKDNIRYYNIPYQNAKGPTYARYYCSKLWRGEEYFLQIDSHTFFEKDWDVSLIKMLEQCRYNKIKSEKHPYGPDGSKKPVLSVYPPTEEQLELSGIPVMDSGKISNNELPVFLASFWSNFESDKPIRSPKPFTAAGLLFLDSSFLYEIQFDPMLCYLFQGEETLFSARLFTHGYDIFAPNIKICSHHYNRNKSPLYYRDISISKECMKFSENKVKYILGLSNNFIPEDKYGLKTYGLGNYRSITDFWNASGIVVKDKKIIKIENASIEWNFYESGYKKIKQ